MPDSFFLKKTDFSFLIAYSFLNPNLEGKKLAGYIIGILVAELILFSLIKGVETLRESWAGRSGRVLEMNAVDEEDWEEVERPSSVRPKGVF